MTLKNPPDPPVLSPDAQSLYLGFSYLHLGRRVKCKWACAQPRVRPLHSLVKIFVQPAHFPDWAKDIGVRHVIQHRNLCATLNLPLSSLPCSSPALSCELLNPVCLPHPSTSLRPHCDSPGLDYTNRYYDFAKASCSLLVSPPGTAPIYSPVTTPSGSYYRINLLSLFCLQSF